MRTGSSFLPDRFLRSVKLLVSAVFRPWSGLWPRAL